MRFDLVIVGLPSECAEIAKAVLKMTFKGSIAIIDDKPDLFRNAPPPVNDSPSGTEDLKRRPQRRAKFRNDPAVTKIREKHVIAFDSTAQTITTNTGETIGYGKIIWASGGEPRPSH